MKCWAGQINCRAAITVWRYVTGLEFIYIFLKSKKAKIKIKRRKKAAETEGNLTDIKINDYTKKAIKNSYIEFELYNKYEVKRGLRDISGRGVLAGLTNISEVFAYTIV